MTNIEDVIRDAALKNHVGLKEDDPVMVLVTVMTRIAEDYQFALNGALENHRNTVEEASYRWRNDAKARAEKILTAALEAGREAMAKGMGEGAAKVAELFRQEMEATIVRQRGELVLAAERFRRYSLWLLAGNGAVMLLALFVAACL